MPSRRFVLPNTSWRRHASLKSVPNHISKRPSKSWSAPSPKVQIIVNGRRRPWTEGKISYEELVKIANLPLPPGPNPGFTITYHDGPQDHPDGTLTAGHSVKVVDCMVFNVTPTNQS